MTASRFDSDREAIAWAREKIQRAIAQAEQLEQHTRDAGATEWAERWRLTGEFMRAKLLGRKGCVIAAFDERLPEATR